MDYDKLIAPAAREMRPSGIRKFFDLAADMPECISLGVGEPDFKTPWAVREAGIESLEHGRTRYTANAGLKELRAEICRYLERRMHLHYDPLREVLVTVGGSEAIDMCIRTIVQPGDEVIIPEPCFVCYEPITQLTGGVPVHIATRAEDQFRLTADQLRAAITPRTKLLIFPYPNNPTGTVLKADELRAWVEYARKNGVLILYDAAYESYITEPGVPHSIYEIDGASEVAVEFRSYSKIAGFTGLRCSSVVVPLDLKISDGRGGTVQLNGLWNRRQCTKYNGCPYIVQRAAEAVHTPEGKKQVMETVHGYLENARVLVSAMKGLGLSVYGGVNAPYIWVSTPDGMDSWSFFDHLLHKASLVCTPGAGFGQSGEGYVRLTAFGTPEDTAEAIRRLQSL